MIRLIWEVSQDGHAVWQGALRRGTLPAQRPSLLHHPWMFQHTLNACLCPTQYLRSETSYFRKKDLAGTSVKDKSKEPIQLCSVALLVFVTPGATLKIALEVNLLCIGPRCRGNVSSCAVPGHWPGTNSLFANLCICFQFTTKKANGGKKTTLTNWEVSLLPAPCSVNTYEGFTMWS